MTLCAVQSGFLMRGEMFTRGSKGNSPTSGNLPLPQPQKRVGRSAPSIISDDLVVIGDKCTILTGALVEHHTILEPGTVVMPYQRIPTGQKWGGNPARFVAELDAQEMICFEPKADAIFVKAKEHLTEFLPFGYSYVHLEDLEKNAAQKPVAG